MVHLSPRKITIGKGTFNIKNNAKEFCSKRRNKQAGRTSFETDKKS